MRLFEYFNERFWFNMNQIAQITEQQLNIFVCVATETTLISD